ncbi:LysR substrate-binding domain-containing protein [Nocardiopsis sp. NPDC058631]|uniref:LysR substrate-binding domain-containing protein n=1 Tax=Nocardiopsis sp. NPDC058631 TaxID=3346566 RepID=UPI00364D8C00
MPGRRRRRCRRRGARTALGGLIPTVAAVDVPGALRDFRRRYPHVRIGLPVGASDDLVEQVREGALEVAFLGLPTTARPQGVHARELARDRHVAVVAPDHPLAGESAVDLRRLSSEVFVDLPAGTAGRVQSDQAFSAAGLSRDVTFEVTSADWPVCSWRGSVSLCSLPPTCPS